MNTAHFHLHRRLTAIDPDQCPAESFWRLPELLTERKYCVLLDSARQEGRLGQWSFLAGQPLAVLTARRSTEHSDPGTAVPAQIRIERFRHADGTLCDEPESGTLGDPLAALRQLKAEYWPVQEPDLRGPPLTAGLLGTVSYEIGRCLEAVPQMAEDDLNLPDLAFVATDEVLACEHTTGTVSLCVTGRGTTRAAARRDSEERTRDWLRELSRLPLSPLPAPDESLEGSDLPLRAHFDRTTYSAAVQRCRDHIRAGDVFEVCLTHRLETDAPASAWSLYEELRSGNPAPFAAYLRFPGFEVVSASPERFLHLDPAGRIESRPIKGTRPRGSTAEADETLRRDLATSPKDRAENLMIVDLVRSDLGRVAEIGSVEVPELLAVEQYATVFQLVSTVQARLLPEYDAVDLLRACFPGGSMTGAPKIEAMKIIDSIEPVARGIYSGAIGYLDAGGAMDLSIVIRTIVCAAGRATFGVGGAVIADSDPVAEYEETLDKARALIRALAAAQAREAAP